MKLSEKLEQAKEELKEAGKELGQAKTEFSLAEMKVKDLQRRVYYQGQEGYPNQDTETSQPKLELEGEDTEEKTEKPSKPSKPPKPDKPSPKKDSSSEDKPSKPPKPDKPSKPAKPSKPSKPKSKEEEEESETPETGYSFDEYSSDMLARDAKDKIRELQDVEDAKKKIYAFIKGDDTPEDRTTVLGVAETHIGEDLVEEVRKLSEEDEGEEEPPKPEKPKSDTSDKDEVDETIDEITDDDEEEDEEESSAEEGSLRVELPDGVDRPESSPECFGNSDIYDPDSHKCMICVFDFECEKAQKAIAENE